MVTVRILGIVIYGQYMGATWAVADFQNFSEGGGSCIIIYILKVPINFIFINIYI